MIASKVLPISSSSPEGSHRKATRVAVASFNTRCLSSCAPDASKVLRNQYARKCQWIADQLDRMGCPDVVAFQEVSDKEALLEVLNHDNLRRYKRKSPQIVLPSCNISGLRNALLTCLPVKSSWVVENIPLCVQQQLANYCAVRDRFLRPPLVVVVQMPNDIDVEIWNIHLKSRRGIFVNGENPKSPFDIAMASARSQIVRIVESVAVRHLILQSLEQNHRPIVLAGDLNDVLYSTAFEIIAGDDPWKRLPYGEKVALWDSKMHNVWHVQSRMRDSLGGDHTYVFNGKRMSLDVVLVSNEFSMLNPGHVGWIESVRTFNDHLVDETISDLEPWASDHGQVVTTIRIGQYHHGVYE